MPNVTDTDELERIRDELNTKVNRGATNSISRDIPEVRDSRTEEQAIEEGRPPEPETDPAVEAILPRVRAPDKESLELQQIGQAIPQIQQRIQNLRSQLSGSEMRSLEASNPGAAALHRQKIGEGISALTNALVQGSQRAQILGSQKLETERQKLSSMIPGWSDPNTCDREKAQMRQWLTSKGYDLEQINHIGSADTVQKLYREWKRESRPGRIPTPVKIRSPRKVGQRAFEDDLIARAQQLVDGGRRKRR